MVMMMMLRIVRITMIVMTTMTMIVMKSLFFYENFYCGLKIGRSVSEGCGVFIGGFSCRGAMGVGWGLIMGLIEKLDWSDYGDIDTEYTEYIDTEYRQELG